jgi:endonuclease/exonuclease/phosphatase family metal-dependent hydrolase
MSPNPTDRQHKRASLGRNNPGWITGRTVCQACLALLGGLLAQQTMAAFTILDWNLKGNGAANWNTNADQVQAIGRVLLYLNPDIITFNEIPVNQKYYMTNWSRSFLSNYNLAISPGNDGYICSAIASKFPITRSRSWLDGANLSTFGYSGSFTRDLFEAQIVVPGFPQPLHVFTTHLKAGTLSSPQNDTNRRGAEASAISNFLVTVYFTTNAVQPYILTGDLNEDIARPDTNNYISSLPVQRLIRAPTGLRLMTPVNAVSGQDFTLSIQGILNVRFDYILPCDLLFSNVAANQIFRTDLLPSPPPPLLAGDSATASDHLPVLMAFDNPYDRPFRLLSIARTNPTVTLRWESVPGQSYGVEISTNPGAWTTLANKLTATGANYSFSANVGEAVRFFRVYRMP